MYQKNISNKLRELNISTRLKGFDYLKEAIGLVCDDTTYKTKVTKRLYPAVAEKFNASSGSVERTIRHALKSAGINKTNTAFIFDFVEDLHQYSEDSV